MIKSEGFLRKPHKWAKEISHKINGGEVERRFLHHAADADAWALMGDEAPLSMFDGDCYEFRIHDPYRELKEAKERGETIQARYVDGPDWRDILHPSWTDGPEFYRIKPREPREGFIPEYADGGTGLNFTEEEMRSTLRGDVQYAKRWIKVREVIE